VNFSIKIHSLIALLASAILTSGVAAAADAIDVKNVADPVRHPYQQTAFVSCIPDACLATFPAITTARTVVLHASCFIGTVNSQVVASVSLSDSTHQVASFLPFTQSGGGTGEINYTAIADPYAFFETGQQPTIAVDVRGPPSDVGITCTLTGYYL
jgi:hypothetical protein